MTGAGQATKRQRERSLFQKAAKTAGKVAGRLRSRAAARTVTDGLPLLQGAASQLKQDLLALRHSL